MQSYIVRYYTVPSYQFRQPVSVVHWDGQRWVVTHLLDKQAWAKCPLKKSNVIITLEKS